MKYINFIFIALLSAASVNAAPMKAVSDFALIDHRGDFYQLSRLVHKSAVVIYIYGNDCAATTAALPKLNVLKDKYELKGVEFLMLGADSALTREEVSAQLVGRSNTIPVLLDTAQLVARSLSVTNTGEVLVIDPSRMEILYRGALDSRSAEGLVEPGSLGRNYVDEVLSAITLRTGIIDSVAWDYGQQIQYAEALSIVPSYEREVAPILERRCLSCHQEGGAAPWAMNSYQMVRGWSQMMSETLMTMRMPPGQIDPEYISDFVNVHYITDDERVALINWVRAGAPYDGDLDPLAQPRPARPEWALGQPDLIVDLPTQEIPATGVLDYKYVPVDIGLDQDRWVRAYEFNIDNPTSLHHAVAYTQDAKQQKQNQSGGGSRTNFGGHAPGREEIVFDDGTGILLKKEMRFVVQFHYQTIGRELSDTSRIGLYFSDKKPDRPLVRTAVMNGEFVIPAGHDNFPVTAIARIEEDSYLYNIAPHMHYRGKSVKYRADFPDGSTQRILSVPNFQHNWQMTYRLKQPMLLPAGTIIVAEGVFDNSPGNALNPDPEREVRWGDQVWDEMFIAWMRTGPAN
jgi:peroxiredoxin